MLMRLVKVAATSPDPTGLEVYELLPAEELGDDSGPHSCR